MATDIEIVEALGKGWPTKKITSTLHCGPSRVQRIRHSNPDNSAPTVASPTGGFSLAGKPLMAKRPTDVWGPRFNALDVDVGYFPDNLADQYGCSVMTLKQRARTAGALRYTEQNGQYVEIIVNPKTRGGK